MVLQKKQLIPLDAVLKSCSIEIIPAVPQKQAPEIIILKIAGIISYGEIEQQSAFHIDVTEEARYDVLTKDVKISIANLIESAQTILQEKYVLKASL